MSDTGWVVERADLVEVLALRASVLRPGLPLDASAYEGERAGVQLAVRRIGEVVGCVALFPAPWPEAGADGAPPDATPSLELAALEGWRLRGMAVAPNMRGSGAGSALLAAGLEAARDGGAQAVWCNARTRALGLYLRHGFVTQGSEFMSGRPEPVPHYRAWVRLDGSAAAG